MIDALRRDDGEDRPGGLPHVVLQALGDSPGVGEVSARGGAGEGGRHDRHEQGCGEHHDDRAHEGVGPLVVDPARRDPLVDDVRLLEEELPGGDGRAHDSDDQEHGGGVEAPLHTRGHEALEEGPGRRVAHERQRDHQEIDHDEDEHEPLPAPEASGRRHGDEADRGDGHRDVLAHPEVAEGKADADEFGGDGEEVEDEEVADGEHSPELAEALVDEPGVTDARDCAQAHHHLLVHDEDRDEEGKRPQEGEAEVLTRLRVGGDAARVVVADHDDQSRPHDGEQGQQARRPRSARTRVVLADGAERSMDVANVGGVKHGRAVLCF